MLLRAAKRIDGKTSKGRDQRAAIDALSSVTGKRHRRVPLRPGQSTGAFSMAGDPSAEGMPMNPNPPLDIPHLAAFCRECHWMRKSRNWKERLLYRLATAYLDVLT